MRRPHAPFSLPEGARSTIADSLNDTAIDLPLMADWVHNRSRIVSCSETTQVTSPVPYHENLGYLSRERGDRRLVVISIDRLSDDGAANAREEFAPRLVFSSFLMDDLSSDEGRLTLGHPSSFSARPSNSSLAARSLECCPTGHPCPGAADTAIERNSRISIQYLDPYCVGVARQLLGRDLPQSCIGTCALFK